MVEQYYDGREYRIDGPEGLRIVGQHPQMVKLFGVIDRLARVSDPVVIQGETGTGKELVAHALHYNRSGGSSAPFVAVNCGGIPQDLVESELFGHARGAFTGAYRARQGKFELASGGTLFLDEIVELGPSEQAALLRVLEEGRVTAVGCDSSRKVNVRVIAATNKDLRVEVEQGKFREDLYYRLGTFPVYVPPLRDRPCDILPIAQYLLAQPNGVPAPQEEYVFTPDAQARLRAQHWRGNVRELTNVVRRIRGLYEGYEITDEVVREALAMGSRPQGSDSGVVLPESLLFASDLRDALGRLEALAILDRLERYAGNHLRTAQSLGIDRSTLAYKLRKYGLVVPESDPLGKGEEQPPQAAQ